MHSAVSSIVIMNDRLYHEIFITLFSFLLINHLSERQKSPSWIAGTFPCGLILRYSSLRCSPVMKHFTGKCHSIILQDSTSYGIY